MSGPGAFDNITSDIAFWGNTAYQGNFNGFRIIDITNPDAPDEVMWYDDCHGGQGDVMIWENLLIRSWDSPAPGDNPDTPEVEPLATCGGQDVPQGFEGLHVFDVGGALPDDPDSIELINSIEITDATADPEPENPEDPDPPPIPGSNGQGCGSHTATLVPDTANDRLLIYNSGSNSQCLGIEIIEIPLADPTTHTWIRTKRLSRQCHDTAVFLGDVMRGVCAGGTGFSVFRMAPEPGDEHPVTLENPMLMWHSGPIPDVTVGHTATFTPDGERFIFGHEPGGGTQAQCEEGDEDRFKMFFYYDTESGDQIGKWFLPRPQGSTENCTLHNINFIPTTDGSDLLVSGNYQAGTWVTDFTDPTNPSTLAFSDPPPVDPNNLVLGGSWSTYWYNGHMYDSNILDGLHIFDLIDDRVEDAAEFTHLNPQTTEARVPQNVVGTSTISIGHKARNPHRFQGSVQSSEDACLAKREVVIVKVRDNGTRQPVAEATTDNNGEYRKKHTRKSVV